MDEELLRKIIASELSTFRSEIKSELSAFRSEIKSEMSSLEERLVGLLASELSSFRAKFKSEIARLESRLAHIENRLDRVVEIMTNMQVQIAGLTRSTDRVDKSLGEIQGIQIGQQRMIDSLSERVAKLEARGKVA